MSCFRLDAAAAAAALATRPSPPPLLLPSRWLHNEDESGSEGWPSERDSAADLPVEPENVTFSLFFRLSYPSSSPFLPPIVPLGPSLSSRLSLRLSAFYSLLPCGDGRCRLDWLIPSETEALVLAALCVSNRGIYFYKLGFYAAPRQVGSRGRVTGGAARPHPGCGIIHGNSHLCCL